MISDVSVSTRDKEDYKRASIALFIREAIFLWSYLSLLFAFAEGRVGPTVERCA
ncbi:hypothetical protein CCP2SC5_290033 [Azospirillaceae bacterium]